MALSTFGAIMGFASERFRHTEDFYRSAVDKARDPVLKEILQALSNEERKNFSLMEQTRRENVTEMVLEPISGLQQEDYEVDLKSPEQAKDEDLLKMTLIIEEKERKFFDDSSKKIPLPEVSSIFRKIAQKKEKNIIKLQALGLEQF